MSVYTGLVKWFDAKKGYGFIHHPDNGSDIFVHYSQIHSDKRFKTLRTGERVAFNLVDGPKGLLAKDVMPTETAAPENEAVKEEVSTEIAVPA